MPRTKMRTIVAYVEDKPGVLNRVASLFRRRNYNIESLNVGRTHEAEVSRMTIVMEADDDTASRLEANLYKLVNVLRVHNLTHSPAVTRDLALIKVSAGPEARREVMEICELFRGRVVDVSVDSVIVEVSGTQEKIDGVLANLRPFGVMEMVQTGAVAMARGADSSSPAAAKPPRRSVRAA